MDVMQTLGVLAIFGLITSALVIAANWPHIVALAERFSQRHDG